ncbi:MAG: response regulator [Planctomycetota bacterium]|nr:MAG: response regulator [Planctomycetota bacterium]
MSDPARQGPRILVVDDDDEQRERLRALLAAQGYQVSLAHDADEAFERVEADPPECVLCDLSAPPSGSDEFCRRLKSAQATRLIPIVVFADLERLQRKIEALDAGADDVLGKPIDPREVAARVRSLVRMRGLTRELEDAQNVVFALATAIEQKDHYTEGHGERVAIYARSLAEHLGLGEDEVQAVHLGGILHDVGKIGCPDAILNKPGPLTPDEFQIIKRHPVHGWEICRHLQSLGSCTLGCIRNHHERLDGTGYPDGLSGDEIPITTRIMSIADVFDALATARAYKPAFPAPTCYRILTEEAERGWWDEELVRAFVDMMRSQELHRARNRARLRPLLARPAADEDAS